MNPVSLLLDIISNLGTLKTDLGDLQALASHITSGQASIADAEKFIGDLCGLLTSGFIPLPAGVDAKALVATIQGAEGVAEALISGVKDVIGKGISAVGPDLKTIVTTLTSAISGGMITKFGGFTKEQVLQVLTEISAGL
jgi:hypothetical protein